MSRANRIGKELARQRAALVRVEQEQRRDRKRRNTVYGSSLGVVLLAIVLGVFVTAAAQPTYTPTAPSNTVADTTGGVSNADGMAIPVGEASAPVKLTVYEDARCAECGAFESKDQSAYKALVASGKLELLVHLVDYVDNSRGGSGSLAAGNAMACAQDAGDFEAYHDVLYAAQPAEGTDAFSSTGTLIKYAAQVSGLDTATFESCVTSGKYDDWVKQNYRELEKIDGIANAAVPTVFANGSRIDVTSLSASTFTSEITALAKAATASPSPSASASASSTAASTASPSTTSTTSASASASPSPSAS
ncbi:thioredoxin domain-containing protein [Actinospica durhamensis]|uniref:Thioredoxin domain-containing protein n=1 Tax=Actinospica durhamensis TaxID=1508375 RepID=A0A941EY95_9ACTN|nr:thioredoxin domain-containing protein [Actinospica durhamensis]MBR7836209.1 thioredoxin domain-containing protein [Actinospica durhamensis]